jgi:hypothetical protein
MILAYELSAQDDDTYMLGERTYRPGKPGFHNWRFGVDGVPHPATCPTCGRKTDPDFVSQSFRVKHRRRDVIATYDGYLIASARVRSFCIDRGDSGVFFVPLPADDAFFWLRSDRMIGFDTALRGTRFERPCHTCRTFYSVVGAHPVVLRGVAEPLLEGFYRTDLEFGSGPEQCPLVIVGIQTAQALRGTEFRGLELGEVTGVFAGATPPVPPAQ